MWIKGRGGKKGPTKSNAGKNGWEDIGPWAQSLDIQEERASKKEEHCTNNGWLIL